MSLSPSIPLEKKMTLGTQRYSMRMTVRGYKFYQILSKGSELILCQEVKLRKYQGTPRRILATIQQKDNEKAFWLIKQIKKNRYEIVHFMSVMLTRGRQRASQILELDPVKNDPRVFRIKSIAGLFLTLDGMLQVVEYQQMDLKQQFFLKEYDPSRQNNCITLI